MSSVPRGAMDLEQPAEIDLKLLRDRLGDRHWRLNNLYKIRNKEGQVVTFKMNKAQDMFYRGMHYRNNILKARKLGFTTEKQIIQLDAAMFEGMPCAMIADRLPTAHRLFRDITMLAYNKLPEILKQANPPKNLSASELVFEGGGSVSIDVTFRGGTPQDLHISEFGKICAHSPEKAREIVTGAYESVPLRGVITNESTAEGQSGYFYDITMEALQNRRSKRALTELDWKLFFFPWWSDPDYRLEYSDSDYEIPHRLVEYFDELEAKHKIRLSPQQKLWYAKKEATLGFDMFRENPSTPEEAFKIVIMGAYYANEFRRVWAENRIRRVPHDPAVAVHTIWDLGVSDATAIWFVQRCGVEWHIIDFLQDSGYGLQHYIQELDKKRVELGYRYGVYVGPHDLKVREWGSDGVTRLDKAAQLGVHFEVAPDLSIADGINAVRTLLPLCWFDESRCSEGLAALQEYRREWDEKNGVWKRTPMHNAASNPADAFRYFAISLQKLIEGYSSVRAAPVSVNQMQGGGFTYA